MYFQFQIIARDQANPEKTATSQIYIRVKRDLKPPKFEGQPYKIDISETTPIEKSVFKVRGRDDDKMVSGELHSRVLLAFLHSLLVDRHSKGVRIPKSSSPLPALMLPLFEFGKFSEFKLGYKVWQ